MKEGKNTLIAKIGIAVAIVAVIAVGVVFLIKNSGEKEASGGGTRDDAQEQTSGHESESNAQGQASGSSVDWDAVEEYGYPPFWLKYANLGALEEKDLSNLMFYDKFAFGISLEEAISAYDYFVAFESDPPFSNYDSLEEFKEWATAETMDGRDTAFNCHVEKESGIGDMIISIYNLTDSEVTVWECIENNQFVYESPYTIGWEIFGIPVPYVQYTDNKEGLTELVELLGRPTMVLASSNDISETGREGEEEFAETVFRGGGSIRYHLMYERGEYILDIGVVENCHDGVYEILCRLSYYTSGYFEYLSGETLESVEMEHYDFE
ncbi:MAG: hypothetical protein K2J95_12185 [Lachnospiraceae bacterium]|nr:hypothetical protein [Lachnospiraceae bacterium]